MLKNIFYTALSAVIFFSIKTLSYTYTYANTTDHTVCVEVHGIGGGFERGRSLMDGSLKDIFNAAKQRKRVENKEAGVITVENPGFHGKSGPECIPPGYTLNLSFDDIRDAGQCYSLTETQFGVSRAELEDASKGLDRITYQFAARPHFLTDDKNINNLVQGISVLGKTASEAGETVAEALEQAAISKALVLVSPLTDVITKLVRESTCKGFGFTIMDIKPPKCKKADSELCLQKRKLYDDALSKGLQVGLNVVARR